MNSGLVVTLVAMSTLASSKAQEEQMCTGKHPFLSLHAHTGSLTEWPESPLLCWMTSSSSCFMKRNQFHALRLLFNVSHWLVGMIGRFTSKVPSWAKLKHYHILWTVAECAWLYQTLGCEGPNFGMFSPRFQLCNSDIFHNMVGAFCSIQLLLVILVLLQVV